MNNFTITFKRDADGRLVIRSPDVRGLFLASRDYDALMRDLAAMLADLLRENHGVDVLSADHDARADSLGSWEHAVAAMRVRRLVEAALALSEDAYDPATRVVQALVREIPGLLDLVAGRGARK